MNLFVCGQTNSGKDTISNHLHDKYGYSKLRIARTIKQIICERHCISFDELEVLKRIDKQFRDEHHEVSEMLGNETASINRLKQLIDGSSMDYEYVDFSKSKIIVDVRTFNEAKLLFEKGYYGIFLTRRTDEYQAGHYTDKFMFTNGCIDIFFKEFNDRFIIIDNHIVKDVVKPEWELVTINTDGTPTNLLETIDLLMESSKQVSDTNILEILKTHIANPKQI